MQWRFEMCACIKNCAMFVGKKRCLDSFLSPFFISNLLENSFFQLSEPGKVY